MTAAAHAPIPAAVWGVGTSSYGLFPDRRIEQLGWEAVSEAVRDAEISPDAIDAVFVGSVFAPAGIGAKMQRGLGITGLPVIPIENACASGTSAYHEAV